MILTKLVNALPSVTLSSLFGLPHECMQHASIPNHSSLPGSCVRMAPIVTNMTIISNPLRLAVFDRH